MHGGQHFLTQNPIAIKKLHSNGRSGDHAIITKYGVIRILKEFIQESQRGVIIASMIFGFRANQESKNISTY
jgi:hypothetical protein